MSGLEKYSQRETAKLNHTYSQPTIEIFLNQLSNEFAPIPSKGLVLQPSNTVKAYMVFRDQRFPPQLSHEVCSMLAYAVNNGELDKLPKELLTEENLRMKDSWVTVFFIGQQPKDT